MPTGHYTRKLTPLADRIEARLDKSGECWEWAGSKTRFGHGQIAVGGFGSPGRRLVFVHRARWEIENGPIPHGMFVLHRCDNPACARPDHLFLGTKQDNSSDMVSKGRQKKGNQLPQAKLTPQDVLDIRSSKETQASIAKRLGVAQSLVSMIATRKLWAHID